MRTHSLRSFKILEGMRWYPSSGSLIQSGPSVRHLDQKTISASLCQVIWWLCRITSLKDICSSYDIHAAYALICSQFNFTKVCELKF